MFCTFDVEETSSWCSQLYRRTDEQLEAGLRVGSLALAGMFLEQWRLIVEEVLGFWVRSSSPKEAKAALFLDASWWTAMSRVLCE